FIFRGFEPLLITGTTSSLTLFNETTGSSPGTTDTSTLRASRLTNFAAKASSIETAFVAANVLETSSGDCWTTVGIEPQPVASMVKIIKTERKRIGVPNGRRVEPHPTSGRQPRAPLVDVRLAPPSAALATKDVGFIVGAISSLVLGRRCAPLLRVRLEALVRRVHLGSS